MSNTTPKDRLFTKVTAPVNLRPEARKAFVQMMNIDLTEASKHPDIDDPDNRALAKKPHIIALDRTLYKKLYEYSDANFIDKLGIRTFNQCLTILDNPIFSKDELSDAEKRKLLTLPNSVKNLVPDFSAETLWITLDGGLIDRMITHQLKLYKIHSKTALEIGHVLKQWWYKTTDDVPTYQKFIVANILLLLKLEDDRQNERLRLLHPDEKGTQRT